MFALALLFFARQAAAQTYPTPTGFTLPAGKSIVVTYEVEVDAEACDPEATPPANLSNQATVSGSNFANVLTNDPDNPAPDPAATLTLFASVTIGNLVYNDVNRDGDYDAGTDAGIDGVLVSLYHDVGTVANELDNDDEFISQTTTAGGGLYSFTVCPDANYIVLVDEENFMGAAVLANAGNPFVTSPADAAGDPDTDTDDNDDNGDVVASFGVAAKALSIAFANNNTVDFGFKTPTTVTINNVTLSEGTGGTTTDFNFTVERNDNSEAFSLTVNTMNGTGTAADNDFTAISNGAVSFTAGGSASATVTVSVSHDNKVEANETFSVVLSGAPAGVVITDDTGAGAINNDDAATVTISGPASQSEGNAGTTQYTAMLTLDNPVQGGFTLNATLTAGTANCCGDDFSGPDAGFTFAGNAGETKNMSATIFGDTKVELNETFLMTITSITGAPTGVSAAGSPFTGTINNDDNATISFSSAGGVSQSEATTPQQFTVNLSNPVDVNVTVEVATTDASATTADSDYTGTTIGQTVTFLANSTTAQTVNIAIGNDNKVEANETYTLGLSNVSAMSRSVSITAPSLVTGTIQNDDAATLTLSAFITEDDEGNSGTTNRQFTVTLDNPVQGGFDVAFTTDDGTATLADNDYQDNDNSLTFNGTANEAMNINVASVGDLAIENNEQFSVSLGNITNTTLGASITKMGSPRQFTLINDEMDWGDAPTAAQSGFASSYPTALANNGARHGAALGGLRLGATIDGDADGQPNVTATGDGADEDGVTLPASIFIGTTANVTVNASATGLLDGWVDFNRDGDWGDAGEQVFTNAAVVSGNNPLSFSVPGDAMAGNSFARFRLSDAGSLSPTGAADDGEVEDYQVNILDNQYSITSPTVAEGNAGTVILTYTISRASNANAGSVDYSAPTGTATSGTDYQAATGGTINFTAGGNLSENVSVTVNGDLVVEDNETVVITLSNPVGGGIGSGGTGTGTIDNDDTATLTFTGGNSELESVTSHVFTATLTGVVQDGFQIAFTTNDGTTNPATAGSDYVDNDASLTFSGTSGEQEIVTVVTSPDVTVELDETFTVALGAFSMTSAEQAASVTIVDGTQNNTILNDDAATVALDPTTLSQAEAAGNQMRTVTLSNPVDMDVTLNFATSDASATDADNDYEPVNQTVTFLANSTTAQTVPVTVNDDFKVETDEIFNITLSSLMAGGRNVALGAATGSGTIANDDATTLTLSGGGNGNELNSGTSGKTFTATLSNPVQGGFSIAYATGGGSATVSSDYADNDGTLTFAGTAMEMQTWMVDVNGDPTVELDETFQASLGAVSGTTPEQAADISVQMSPQTWQITNDDAATVSIAADVSQAENMTPQAFSVTLSNPVDVPVTVDFSTADGSATDADNDYEPLTNQTVTFSANSTTAQTVNVTINNDSKVEANETFGASVGSLQAMSRNVSLGTSSRTGTIENDDMATLTLTGGGSQTEGTSHVFTATLSHAVQGGFTVAYATNDGTAFTADSDYTDNDNSLTFTGNANEQKTITVLTGTDPKVELDETFTVALGTPSAASVNVSGSPQTGTIANNDAAIVSLDPATLSQAEAAGNQMRTVTLSNPVDMPVTVNFATSDNTATDADNDYEPVNQSITFLANSTTAQNVTVTINNDFKVEADEIFNITLSSLMAQGRNVAFGAATGSGTIANDDASTLTLTGGGSANELHTGTSGKVFTATLTNPVQGGFTLNFTTNNGTATVADNDYADNDGSIAFAGTANEAQTITVIVNGDHLVEADETFTVNMNSLTNTTLGSGITLAGSPQTWTILNDEVDWGDAPLAAQSGFANDYNTTLPDSAARHTAVFGIRLGASIDGETNGQPTATANGDDATTLDDEDGVTLPAAFITGTTQTITVNASAAGFIHGWIDWNRNGHWNFAEQVLNNVAVVPGDNTFNISTPADASVGASFARFRYRTATGALEPLHNPSHLVPADGELEDYQVSILNNQYSISSPSVTEGNAGAVNLTFVVSRTANTSAGSVDYAITGGTATSGSDYAPLANGTINFTAGGSLSENVVVQVNGDVVVETNETIIITLSNPVNGGIGASPGTGTITNDDMATLTLSGGSSQTEGTSHVFTATLSHEVQGGFTVAYTTNDGTAFTADNDYVDNDNSLTFTGNANEQKTITVLTGTDPKVELDETFTVALGTPSAANVNLSGSPQTGTIANDDSAVLSIAANVSQSEATSPQQFSISLSNPVDVPVTVEALTADGSATNADMDYSPYFQSFTFPMNSTTAQTANVTVSNDNKVEDHETYAFKLQNLGAMGRSVTLGTDKTGTIQNDDSATITLSGGTSVSEGNSGSTPVTFTATVDNPVQGGFTVFVQTATGTANSSDFSLGDVNLSFNGTAGEFINVLPVVNGDTDVEPDETFFFQFGSIVNPNTIQIVAPTTVQTNAIGTAGSPQTATIVNDDIDWGDAPDSYQTLAASNGPAHGGSNLRLGTLNDGDADGQPNPTGTGDDTDGDGDDEDGVTLPSAFIATTTASVTVNASAAGKLDAWMDFNADGDFDLPGEQIFTNQSVSAGSNSLTFAMPPTVTQGASFARFRLSSAGNLGVGGLASDGEVEDYQVQLVNTQFSIDDPTITEGNAGTTNLTFTISRSTNGNACSVDYAITGGTAVSTGTANTGGADYQTFTGGTVNFTAGGSFTQTVNVVVNGDLTVELNETVLMTLSNPVGGNILDGSGTGTITNDDAATISLSSPSIAEGNAGTTNLTFTITMTNPADANVAYTYVAYDGTATQADNDYQATGNTQTFAPGETSKTVNVPVVGDCKIEPNETFLLTLGGLTNNGRNVSFSGGGGTTSGTGTITNDDELPGITCPGGFNQNTDPGVCDADVTLTLPTLSSLCGSSTLEFRHRTVDANNNPLDIFGAWHPSANNTQNFAKSKWEVEWRVTDGSGSSTCNLYFEVQDNEPPVANCKNVTVQLNAAGTATVTVFQVNNLSTDNCSFSLSLSQTTFNCSHVGPNTVTLTTTDPSGNSDNCTATVTVQDVTPPVALCKPATVFLNSAGQASVAAAQVNNNSTDACGIASLSVSPNAFTCSNLGANTVTLTVTDVNSNSATCTATVTVVDNLPPTVACQNITLTLASNGYASITSPMVFNAAGSSDNCGTVNPQSVSQAIFDCSDIGANVVTLTGNDGNGNTGTCSATVTVAPFITIVSVTVTPANCNGSDGGITIVATALGGQLRYSIDNFASFNLTGVFNNLAPGTYPVSVMAAGTSGCSLSYGTVTVGTTGSPQTWYQDVDGDGYSNGNSQVSCSQPANYYLAASLIATSGDCDDNDPLEFPGQVWYKDQDNDGYSNGMTLTQCLKPVNYKALSQLVAPPTGSNVDCNDTNANVKPGATELCNSLDDDCDGQVDEGAGGQTYVGNVTLNSQTGTWSGGTGGVNYFPSCYSVIDGNLTIQNSTVNSLAALSNLVKVTGDVTIKITSLVNMNGLHNLDTIGGNLTINNNNYGSKLNSLDGLEDLDWVGGNLKVYYNFSLTDCCAIEDLVGPEPNGTGGTVSVYSNKAGCNTVAQIIACPGFTGGGGNNLIVTPDQPCPDCPSTATGENWQVMAFPNPASTELTVEIEGEFKAGTVSLTDLAGRELLRRKVLEGETQVSLRLDEIGGGLYFLQVRSETGEVKAIRVVVAK